jgi:hypothetical protein
MLYKDYSLGPIQDRKDIKSVNCLLFYDSFIIMMFLISRLVIFL